MDIINYTEARKNLSSVMDQVCDNHAPMAVTRRNGEAVVMMSLKDYNAWEETMYLLKSDKNRARLMHSIDRVENGQVNVRDLIETDEE